MVEDLKCKSCGCGISAFEYVEFDGRCYSCNAEYEDMIAMKARAYEEAEEESKSDK